MRIIFWLNYRVVLKLDEVEGTSSTTSLVSSAVLVVADTTSWAFAERARYLQPVGAEPFSDYSRHRVGSDLSRHCRLLLIKSPAEQRGRTRSLDVIELQDDD